MKLPVALALLALASKANADPENAPRQLTLGAVATQGDGGTMLRGELDLLARGPWSLGLAGELGHAFQYEDDGSRTLNSGRGLVYAAHTSGSGPWHVRGSLGVGVGVGTGIAYVSNGLTVGDTSVFPVLEAALTLTRDISDSWGITGGPMVVVQAHNLVPTATDLGEVDASLGLFFGLSHRF